jgi:hypothetical protein
MPFGLGFFATAGAGAGAAGSFDLLETQVLASPTSSVTFSSLSTYAATYQHLQIRYTTRSARATDSSFTKMIINGDSSANYSEHFMRGNGTSIQAVGNTNVSYIHFGDTPAANATANVFNAGVFDLLDAFETTKFKTTRNFSGVYGGGITYCQLWSGNWRNTNAVSSFTISDFFGANLATGSRFSLYGSKVA